MVGRGEIEQNISLVFDAPVLVKLSAIIGGNGFESIRQLVDERQGALIERIGRAIFELTDLYKAGFSFQEGDDTITGTVAHDGIDFPVALVATGFDTLGAFRNMAFIRESATAIVGSIALAA